ncbi:MAG: rod shape-determining protein MreC [Campylobacterota bacterium]|nr:rod shape-determining protein MreC [Campylobacterota bacterium]
MNKKLILFFSIIFIITLYLFNVERIISNKISTLTGYISSTYLNTFISIESTLNKYLSQIDYIEQLTKINEENQLYKTKYIAKANELELIINEELNRTLELDKTKILSYKEFYDTSKVILDYPVPQKEKIYALISKDGNSVGIVLNKDNKTIGLLNNNKKCNYTVYIGDENAPGITSGMTNNGRLIIKHIPLWKNIQVGDKVITSGMDNIFPVGINVGEVRSIQNKSDTKEIFVQPYTDIFKNRYLYIYRAN